MMKAGNFRPALKLISSAVLPAAAQEKQTGDAINAPSVFEMRPPVVVPDKKKRLVGGLTQDYFVVFENDQKQQITYFGDETVYPPVLVAVLPDTSPSMQPKPAFSKQATGA